MKTGAKVIKEFKSGCYKQMKDLSARRHMTCSPPSQSNHRTVRRSTALQDNAALPETVTKHSMTPPGSTASGDDEARRHDRKDTYLDKRMKQLFPKTGRYTISIKKQ